MKRDARGHPAPLEREAEFTTASVVDLFGNVLSVMHNPHCLEMLAAGAHP